MVIAGTLTALTAATKGVAAKASEGAQVAQASIDLKDLIPVGGAALGLLATAWSAAFLTGRLSPNIELRIIPTWGDDGGLRLALEVENSGYIRAKVKKVLFAIHEAKVGATINNDLKLIGKEFISFEHAEKVMSSSYYINPKEVIHVERIYQFPTNGLLHVGLQIYLDYPWYIKILGGNARSTRQTKTYYISRQLNDDTRIKLI